MCFKINGCESSTDSSFTCNTHTQTHARVLGSQRGRGTKVHLYVSKSLTRQGLKAKGPFAMCTHCMAGDTGQWHRGRHSHSTATHTHTHAGTMYIGAGRWHGSLARHSSTNSCASCHLYMLPSQMPQRLTVPVFLLFLFFICYRHRRLSASKSSAARASGQLSWLNPNPQP